MNHQEDTPRLAGRSLLIVAMAASVHLARWVGMLRHSGMRIAILTSVDTGIAPELSPYTLIRTRRELEKLPAGEVGVFDIGSVDAAEAAEADATGGYVWPGHPAFPAGGPTSPHVVGECIARLRPDMVHSMEVQFAGYIVLEAKRRVGRDAFPPWIVSNWGSDIFLFRKLAAHRETIERIFQEADGYWAECVRDTRIAEEFGYRGAVLTTMPASGGMELPPPSELPPSRRDVIMIKGYHGWSGRGLHIFSALYLAAPELRDFRIVVSFPLPHFQKIADELARRTGLDVKMSPYVARHEEALARLAGARMVVGIGISDGISTTLLEAMGVGAFPIVANTTCGGEWLRDGLDGFIVDPHDTNGLAAAITRAASDDALVDAAAIRNRHEVGARWDPGVNGRIALRHYAAMLSAREETA
jgi:glycosyltransferase involved in cell wall biosynthesis